MAKLKQALTEDEIKKKGLADVRKAYNELAKDYNKIINGNVFYCHSCNEFHTADYFYSDKRYASGLFPECKQALLKQAVDYDKKSNTYTDNKKKTIEVFKKLNLPFIDGIYNNALQSTQMELGEVNRKTAYQHTLTIVKSLPQYKEKTFEHSEFDDDTILEDENDINENSKIIKAAKKRFGRGYTLQDLYFLETQYEDWVSRYSCESKAQEILFQRICFKQLEIDKAQKLGKDTKELDKTLQDLMSSSSIKPNQANSSSLSDSKTFGELIDIWENELDGGNPIPEPDEDFKDVDKIGQYIDVFFKGHLSKMMGLKNGFSALYEKFIKKYTVNKPQYDEDEDSETLFNQIFGEIKEDE
jgi:hypothetical protein